MLKGVAVRLLGQKLSGALRSWRESCCDEKEMRELMSSVATRLDCLSVAEARIIGSALAPALRARKTAEAGLYQWAHQNASMVELF